MSIPSLNPLPKAPNRTRGLRFLLLTSALVAISLLAYAAVQILTRQPASVLLVSPRSANLSLEDREALATLIQDHLEYLGNLAVATTPELPPAGRLDGLSRRTLILAPTLSRQGDRLAITFSHAWLSAYRRDPQGCWRQSPPILGSPAPTVNRALRTLPLYLSRNEVEHFLPLRDSLFWTLVRGQALHRNEGRMAEAQSMGAEITNVEPECASAWILRGDILYRRLLSDPLNHGGAQEEAESHFAKALALLPHHPRGTFLLAEMRIDAGNQRAALDQLQAATREFSRAAALQAGIAYAARTAGLLGLARLALERRDSLCPPVFSSFTSENTYLYLGERQRFEETLVEYEGNPRNAVTRFYRGYLALASGDRQSARKCFDSAAQSPESLGQFRELSRLYACITAGNSAEALRILHQLEKARAGLRVPDGEFTFKMGEAYALLGHREAALDMVSRAFAQGFGCTRWYLESPFLGDIRELPRWKALVLHIQERQQLLEGRFPPSDFGL